MTSYEIVPCKHNELFRSSTQRNSSNCNWWNYYPPKWPVLAVTEWNRLFYPKNPCHKIESWIKFEKRNNRFRLRRWPVVGFLVYSKFYPGRLRQPKDSFDLKSPEEVDLYLLTIGRPEFCQINSLSTLIVDAVANKRYPITPIHMQEETPSLDLYPHHPWRY